MAIGKVIYYHRRKQNKTQEQLCSGICSVTHLSKIENSTKEANPKTLRLLCERLQINIEEENKKSQLIKLRLDQLIETIERMNVERAKALFHDLLEYREYVHCTDMIYLFELYKLRYFLLIDDLQSYEESSKGIHRYISKFSPYESYVWDFIQAIYFGKKEQYVQALVILSRNEEQAELFQTKMTEYHYYRAAVHGHLSHYSLSIHYAYKAMQIFQATNNFIRILYSKMILAVNFIYIGEYDKGKDMLEQILSDTEMLQYSEARSLALHNLGFLFFRKGQYKDALDYYTDALQAKHKGSPSYYITITYKAEALIANSQNMKAAKMLKEILDSYQGPKSSHYSMMKILYLEASCQKKKLIQYLTKHGMPDHMSIERSMKYLEMIAAYYEEKRDFATANHYLHISTKHLKNLLINTGLHIDSKKNSHKY